MRLLFSILALFALAACDATPPNDVASMAINPALTGPSASTAVEPQTTTAAITSPATPPAKADASTDATSNVVINTNNPTISDTQNFEAVTKKESIKSDKARLEAQRKKFIEIMPTALPTRGKSVNVAAYALNTTNVVGERKFNRSVGRGSPPNAQSCSRFNLPSDAQAAFLRDGGPRSDPGNLDPDGDGFACAWTPDALRKLVR